MIYNSEYEELIEKYSLPVFFKSTPNRSTKFFDQGFIDNGKEVMQLKSDEEMQREQMK